MKPTSKLLWSLLVISLIFGIGPVSISTLGPSPAHAQDILDDFLVSRANPNVLLFIDTSQSMEDCYGGTDVGDLDGVNVTNQNPGYCDSGGPNTQSSRMDVAYKVLYQLLNTDGSIPAGYASAYPTTEAEADSADYINNINSNDEDALNMRFGMGYYGPGAGGGSSSKVHIGQQIVGATAPNDPPFTPSYSTIWDTINDLDGDGPNTTADGLDVARTDFFPTAETGDLSIDCRYQAMVLVTNGDDTAYTSGGLGGEIDYLGLGFGSNSAGNGKAPRYTAAAGDNSIKDSDCSAQFFPDDGTGWRFCGDGFKDNPNFQNGQLARHNADVQAAVDLQTNGIDLFVVGMGVGKRTDGVDNTNRQFKQLRDTLDLMASNGDTGAALFAENADELIAALLDVIGEIQIRAYSFTTPVVPTIRLTDNNNLYQAWFLPDGGAASPFWHGHLESFDLEDDGSLDPTTTSDWDVYDRLDTSVVPDDATRNIFWSSVNGQRDDFTTADTDLTFALLGVADDTEKAIAIEYLRGDTTAINPRTLRFGDVFHSTPKLVGTPSRFFGDIGFSTAEDHADVDCPDGSSAFRDVHALRDRFLILGANDGFFHAIHAGDFTGVAPFFWDDGTGNEIWAYAPRSELDRLKLIVPSLGGTGHHFYADSSPQVADVWFDDGGGAAGCDAAGDLVKQSFEWRTVMVSGLGRGGKSVVALEVTSGDAANLKALWEAPTPNYAWSEPKIGRVLLTDLDSVVFERWVAFLGGGYAHNHTLLSSAAAAGDTVVTVDSTDGAQTTCGSFNGSPLRCLWICGELIRYTGKTATTFTGIPASGFGSITAACAVDSPALWLPNNSRLMALDLRNGVEISLLNFAFSTGIEYPLAGTPATLDIDGDGYIDSVYIADIGGNLHEFDVSAPGSLVLDEGAGTGWRHTDPAFYVTGGWTHRVLFESTKPPTASYYQPVYVEPEVVMDENRRIFVYFGTGDIWNSKDAGEKGKFYAILDDDPATPYTDSDLDVVDLSIGDPTDPAFEVDPTDPNYKGFLLEFPSNGEKVLTRAEVFNKTVFFTTFVPDVGADLCGGGHSNLYGVHYLTAGFGLDLAGDDGVMDARKIDNVTPGMASAPVVSLDDALGEAKIYIGGAFTDIVVEEAPPPTVTRQILKWQDIL